MKTISVKTKKISIIVGVIMAILILLVFNAKAAGPDPENDLRYKSEVIKVQKAAKNLTFQKESDCEQSSVVKLYKFFDDDENLLYETAVNTEKVMNDEKLIKLLHQSDLVINLNYASFYRYSK